MPIVAVLLFTILVFPLRISAQSVARPDRGSSIVSTHEKGEVDRVDLRNGNLSISVPLASLPPISGGKLGLTIFAHYNSKLWDSHLREEFIPGYPDYEQMGAPIFFAAEVPRLSSTGGWRIGEKYQLLSESASNDFVRSQLRSSANDPDYSEINANSWHKTVLITPDGARHELRPFGFPSFTGSNDFYRGYYKVNASALGSPVDYYSFDGSFLRVRVFPHGEELSWRALQPDGTMIEVFRDGRQRISDTNGNSILIFEEGQNRFFREERTGRELILRKPSESLVEVLYRTVGGGWATVNIRLRKSIVTKLFRIEVPDSDSIGGCSIHEPISAEILGVEEIEFPRTEAERPGLTYRFEYNDHSRLTDSYVPRCGSLPIEMTGLSEGGGELKTMVIPSGAVYRFEYHLDGRTQTGENRDTVLSANTVSRRTIEHDRVQSQWTYTFGSDSSSVKGPDGIVKRIERYPSWLTSGLASDSGFSGLVYRETTESLLTIERRWKRLVFPGADDRSAEQRLAFNPVVSEEYRTVYSHEGLPVKTSATTFEHDLNGNLLSITVFDWFDVVLVDRDEYGVPKGVPEAAPVLSRTINSYHHSPSMSESSSIYHSNTSRIISTRSGAVSGYSVEEFGYDGLSHSVVPEKGNLTSRRRWSSSEGAWIEERFEHDVHGNVVKATDPNGNETLFSYDDEVKAFPTSVTRKLPANSKVLKELFSFDFHTGLLLSATDANGHISSVDYYNHLLGAVDPFSRPGIEVKPSGTRLGKREFHETQYLYEDSFNRIRIDSDVITQGDRGRKTRHTKDQLGRSILIEKNENGSENFTISSRIVHSSDGLSILTENPKRDDIKSKSDGWTRIIKDGLGRTTTISTFSGRRIPSFNKSLLGTTGEIVHRYDGTSLTVIDQNGHWVRRHSDALGRLSRVDEPNAVHLKRETTSPTFFSYDSNSNLIQVEQGEDTRAFEYDSLSRLIGESSPESGQSRYRHDSVGNRIGRIDANGNETFYHYDELSRLIKVDYQSSSHSASAEPTPSVRYEYDDSKVVNSLGRLTAVISDHGARFIDHYDESGRITGERVVISAQEFPLNYEYSVGGRLTEMSLPSGRKNTFFLDASGELSGIGKSKIESSGGPDVVSDINYHPDGSIAFAKYGNSLWESNRLNSRLQPEEILLGSRSGDGGLFSLRNHFTLNSRTTTKANNGNIHRQTVVSAGESREFSYKYDPLNRVSGFQAHQEQKTIASDSYSYDRNGNLRIAPQDQIDSRRGSRDSNTSSFSDFTSTEKRDAVGNLLWNSEGGRNLFDAENRLLKVETNEGLPIAEYRYDGEGRRISKTLFVNEVPEEVTLYIHDSSGRVVAEYSSSAVAINPPRRLFLTSDHLGSVRLVTDQDGRTVSRHDYDPFGRELLIGDSKVEHSRFAGHEKDSETGFHHARSRTFSSKDGRFLSADPISIAPERLKDPQRLNRFSYVRNSPLRFSDPSGEDLYIKITNIVVGYQYLVDVSSGKRIRTEVFSYRVIVTNDSGTRRIFEVTRGSSHGKRGEYGRLQEAPPGEYMGKIRQDGRRGFRVELTEPGQPDGQMTTPDAIRNRGNIQLHRNGLYVEGCMTFPVSDYDRFQETITRMIEQDRTGGFGTKIFVSLIPRNERESSSDLFPGDPRISESELPGDQDGTLSKTKKSFDGIIPPSPARLQ